MNELMFYIQSLGYFSYFVLFLIVFLESFPMTCFLPGDSLLFTAGFMASVGYFDFKILLIIFFAAAVSGYILSYKFGQKIVIKLFTNENSKIFNPKHVIRTHNFFEKYGGKTVIIGRFIPFVRSLSPALAGIANVSYRKFLFFTFIGAILWVGGVTSLGYYLGNVIPGVEKYLTPIVLIIVFLSLLPTIYEYIKYKIEKKKLGIKNSQ